jgi:hypothetical protein
VDPIKREQPVQSCLGKKVIASRSDRVKFRLLTKTGLLAGVVLTGYKLSHLILPAIGVAAISNPVGIAVLGVSVLFIICGSFKLSTCNKALIEHCKKSIPAFLITIIGAIGTGIALSVLATLPVVNIAYFLIGFTAGATFNWLKLKNKRSADNNQKYTVMQKQIAPKLEGVTYIEGQKGVSEWNTFNNTPTKDNWKKLIKCFEGLSEEDTKQPFPRALASAIYTSDMKGYYKKYVTSSNRQYNINGIKPFMTAIGKARTTGSQTAIALQQSDGSRRPTHHRWLYDNLPTVLDEQTMSIAGEKIKFPVVRHANTVINLGNKNSKGDGHEDFDPVFDLHLKTLEKENKYCFYTTFLNAEDGRPEKRGLDALKVKDSVENNFYLLTQSMDHKIYSEEQNLSPKAYLEELSSKYTPKGEAEQYFQLPDFISSNNQLKGKYAEDLEAVTNTLIVGLGLGDNNTPIGDLKTQQAYCLIFYAAQRDHMKKFMAENIKEQQLGHYTTPCKDFLDRGGTAFATEMLLHHFQGSPTDAQDNKLLEQLYYNMTGAAQVTKKVGVLKHRIEPFEKVFEILKAKQGVLTNFMNDDHAVDAGT